MNWQYQYTVELSVECEDTDDYSLKYKNIQDMCAKLSLKLIWIDEWLYQMFFAISGYSSCHGKIDQTYS